MAHVRGLMVAAVALLLMTWAGVASAATYEEAFQSCLTARSTFMQSTCADPATTQCATAGTYPTSSKVYYTRYYKTSCGNSPAVTNFFYTSGYSPTRADCLALNDGGVRDKISTSNIGVSYCNNGPSGTPPGGSACWMSVSSGYHKSEMGRDSAGNPLQFYYFEQRYDGSSCSDHANPPLASDQAGTDAGEPDPSGNRCIQARGVCFDSDDNMQYCTFNSNGTPSSCVPAMQDSDNDGVPDNQDSSPGDPDNGADNGTGNEADNTSSGGGDCGAAPVSSGDAIAAQIAYQTWATRCAIEKSAMAQPGGSACASALTCAGLTLDQCFERGLQKRAACGTETTNTTLTSTNTKIDATNTKLDTANTKLTSIDGKLATIATNTAASGTASPDAARDCTAGDTGCSDLGTSGVTGGEGGTGWTTLPGGGTGGTDDSGWLTSRSCPAPVSVTVMGITIDLNRDAFCDFMGIGSMLVLIGAALASAKIVGGAI